MRYQPQTILPGQQPIACVSATSASAPLTSAATARIETADFILERGGWVCVGLRLNNSG